MKNIFTYKVFGYYRMFNEKYEDEIEYYKNLLNNLNQIEELGDEAEEALKFQITMIKSSNYPKKLVESTIVGLKCMCDPEYRKVFRKIIELMLQLMVEQKDLEEISKNEELKKLGDEITDISCRITGLSKEKILEISGGLISGLKKAKEMRDEESSKAHPTNEDPYGEEEWDGQMGDDEIIRKAFGDD